MLHDEQRRRESAAAQSQLAERYERLRRDFRAGKLPSLTVRETAYLCCCGIAVIYRHLRRRKLRGINHSLSARPFRTIPTEDVLRLMCLMLLDVERRNGRIQRAAARARRREFQRTFNERRGGVHCG